MSKLDELIKKRCPDGVEYKRLGEIVKIKNGCDYKHLQEGNIPVYGSGGIINYVNEFQYDKPSVLIPRKGSLDKLYYVDTPFWNVDTIFYTIIDTSIVFPKFLYFVLQKAHLENLNKAGGVPSLTQSALNKVSIPIPPLEVQREIVNILDNFTELTAELTAELTVRKKQYEYYRNRLLTFDMNISEMKLSDVCDYVDYRGKTPVKSDSGVFLVTAKNIKKGYIDYDSSKEYIPADTYDDVMHRGFPQVGDVLITTEAPCGNVAQVDRADIALAQRVIKLRGKTNILRNRYLKFILLSQLFQDRLMKAATGSTVKGIKGSTLLRLSIPVPSLDVQDKIADVLDNFDKVCNDLHIGLPAEIEARKKQYEFYRDSLLTFLEKGESILTEQNRTELRYALIKLLQYVFGYVIFPISTVGKVLMCKRIFKEQTMPIGDVPFYKIGTFGGQADAYIDENLYHEYKNKYSFPLKGEILISCSGTIGRCIIYDGEPAYFQDSNIVWVSNDESIVLNKFLYYLYKTMSWNIVSGGTIGRLYKSDIEKTLIKVPPKDKQVKIVSILERFDALCHDLSSGLPAEIEARKKQYEYYRDKLLSFKEKKG